MIGIAARTAARESRRPSIASRRSCRSGAPSGSRRARRRSSPRGPADVARTTASMPLLVREDAIALRRGRMVLEQRGDGVDVGAFARRRRAGRSRLRRRPRAPARSAAVERTPPNGLPQYAIAMPQCAIAQSASRSSTRSKPSIAARNSNECSSATPRSNSARDGRRAARLEVHRAELLRRRACVLAVLGRDECRRDKREDNEDDQ